MIPGFRLNQKASEHHAELVAHTRALPRSCARLEQAMLWRLPDQGPRLRPYDGDALRFLTAIHNKR